MKKINLSLTICMFFLLQFCYAESYHLSNDFSSTNNPNKVWSYGFLNNQGVEFKLLNKSKNFNGSPDEIAWWIANTSNPSICKNPTDKDISFTTVSISPHSVAFHPGPNGENAVIRWTAPKNGTYLINAIAKGIDYVGPTTSEVSILHNNQMIWNVLINNYNEPNAFSKKLLVSLGDFVDFTCEFGSNGDYYYDTTAIDITITKFDECNILNSNIKVDYNGDCKVDIKDAIYVLKSLSGIH